jgi:putative salt-induced outer membrane protein
MKISIQWVMSLVLILLSVLAPASAEAQDTQPLPPDSKPWAHESEIGILKVGGNAQSDSYNGKQKTAFVFEKNAITATGRYLEAKSAGTQTAKSWDAALRYERILSEIWSAFVQQGAESDVYAGYTQRDNSDFGAKYTWLKTDSENLLSEAGYRYSKTLSSVGLDTKYESLGRLFAEYSRKLNGSVTTKFWIEYLPNFSDSQAYLLNYEPSATVMLNHILSMKMSYLVKFHNKTMAAGENKEDTTFSTALVAKF